MYSRPGLVGDLTQALHNPHRPEVAVRERDLRQLHDGQGVAAQLDQGVVVDQDKERCGGKLINL